MSETNTNLYRGEQVRAMDRMVIEQRGIPGIDLMERAGLAAFELLRCTWPEARSMAVFCGTGNNGGDGYVIARLAVEAGMQATLYQLGDHSKLTKDALTASERLAETSANIMPWSSATELDADVIVDALLGTGLDREVSGHYRDVIERINESGRPVLAVDIPSGLHADTGSVLGVAIKAEQTISFIGMKQGLFTGQAADYVGTLHYSDLAIPENIFSEFETSALAISYESLRPLLKPRRRTSHKGTAGHVLIIGGNHGFSGAVRMAGEAALRAGAGLVSIATRVEHAVVITDERPELMVHGVEESAALLSLLEKADVVAIGPGLGQDEWAMDLFATTVQCQKPLVVDADALNLLARSPQHQDNWILTPHPGEAARLLGVSTQEIDSDRYTSVLSLQQKYGGTMVLKGAGSLVCSSEPHIAVCTEGNPGMASGGMGDVLTGIIASLRAQGLSDIDATQLGVCLHGAAADRAVMGEGERGLLASDLMPWIRKLVNP